MARALEKAPGNRTSSRSEPHPGGPIAPPRPLRVLIVDTAIAFGGTLAVARNLLKHLDPNVIDASLVSACADGFVSRGFAGEAEIRLLAPRIDYVTLQNWKVAIRKRVRWGPARRGLELVAMGMEFLANMPYVIRLAHLCRKKRIDVLHSNNYAMEPLWVARLLGIAIVSHLHGMLYPPLEGTRRRNFRHVKAFVSISRAVTQSVVRTGIDRTRIHEIPNFVERVPDASPPPLPADPAIGIFGRVTHWKGQKEFLRAAIRVLEKFPHLKVYVVGDASDSDPAYFEQCREIARTSPCADRFEFTGRVTDVAEYYRKCTVVVHASIEPEPFGMVLIEAMAQARPLIASTFGAASEIITDGVEGFIVNPKDTAAMLEKLTELLLDPARVESMGIAGLNRVRTTYDPRIGARKFADLYSQVASASSARR